MKQKTPLFSNHEKLVLWYDTRLMNRFFCDKNETKGSIYIHSYT